MTMRTTSVHWIASAGLRWGGAAVAGRLLRPVEPGFSRGGCTGQRRSDGIGRKSGGVCGGRRRARRPEAVFALVRAGEGTRTPDLLFLCRSHQSVLTGGIVWILAW